MMKIPCSVWMPSLIKKYRHADGTDISISRICWDIGGIDAEIVYKRSKKHGIFRVLPVKGASVYGKPVITMPKKTQPERGIPVRNRY